MPAERVREYLESHGVAYEAHSHDRAVTAQAVAAAEHESGWHVAKPVFLEADGRLAMFVVPAPMLVDLERAAQVLGVDGARLADEAVFSQRFPDCETGAEPPFGRLYDVPTYVDERLLTEQRILFAAGTHTETFSISLGDYLRAVEPQRVKVGVPAEG